jgi:hypothetical protein
VQQFWSATKFGFVQWFFKEWRANDLLLKKLWHSSKKYLALAGYFHWAEMHQPKWQT